MTLELGVGLNFTDYSMPAAALAQALLPLVVDAAVGVVAGALVLAGVALIGRLRRA